MPAAPEELASGGGEGITAQLVDIEGKLTSGLTGIEEVRDAVFPCDRANRAGRVDQATIGGDVVERDQCGWPGLRPSNGGVERVQVDFAVLVGGNHLNLGTGSAGEVEVGDEIGAVLGFGREDPVTGLKAVGR